MCGTANHDPSGSELFPPLPAQVEAFSRDLADHALPEEDYSRFLESICGTTDDSQPVEQYDGSLGVTTGFVDDHQGPVGQLQWNSNLATIYTNPGNVSGVRWCTGTLIGGNLFLTAGHCFDQDAGAWELPRVNGSDDVISSEEIATNMHVNFNYQVDPNGVLRPEQQFAVEELIEYRLGNLDFGILRLAGDPHLTFGTCQVATDDPQQGDPICIIGHPAGVPKRIEAGAVSALSGSQIRYNDIDTLGGNSGSAVLLSPGGTVVGVHTNGGCTTTGGFNFGMRISNLLAASPTLSGITVPPAEPRWVSLGAPPGGATGSSATVLASGGRLAVFVRGSDDGIWYRQQDSPGGDWSDWESVGAPPGGATGSPGAGVNQAGGLVAVTRGGDGDIWVAAQDRPDGDWG
jgi:V8-like Glu-specific endopeptidase